MAYDIIGDVHGHVDRLRALLKLLGYMDKEGNWADPGRKAVFVGDLIDRGPGQLKTLRLVRSMVEEGLAQVVLGNHEFNAVAYATVDPVQLAYCRPHNDKNTNQHEAFLADVAFGFPLHRSIMDWFMTFPLWLDLGGLRVVHACWSDPHIEHLRTVLADDCTLTEQVVIDGTTKGTDTYKAIETVLKGPEVHLNGAWYEDKEENPRHDARLRWWDGEAKTLRTAALIPPGTQLFGADNAPIDELPDRPLRDDEVAPYSGEVPVLFGHYWWRKEDAEEINSMATCVDYSVAKHGVLRAYQWDGKANRLDETKFVDC